MKRRAVCGPFANDHGLSPDLGALLNAQPWTALSNYRTGRVSRHIVLRFLMSIGVRSFTNERIIHICTFRSQAMCAAPMRPCFPWPAATPRDPTPYTHAPGK